MINPPSERYKIRPTPPKPRNMTSRQELEGEGDAAFEASSGGGASSGRIDPSKAPEVPMTEAVKPEPKPAPKPAASTNAKPAVPTPPPASAPSLGGARPDRCL